MATIFSASAIALCFGLARFRPRRCTCGGSLPFLRSAVRTHGRKAIREVRLPATATRGHAKLVHVAERQSARREGAWLAGIVAASSALINICYGEELCL